MFKGIKEGVKLTSWGKQFCKESPAGRFEVI